MACCDVCTGLIPGENSHITLSQSVGWFAPFFVWSYTSEIKTWDPTNIKFRYASYDTIAGIAQGIAAVKRERIAAHAQAAIDYLTKINLPHNMILTPTELYLFPRRPTVRASLPTRFIRRCAVCLDALAV